jgi:hypothetical protein
MAASSLGHATATLFQDWVAGHPMLVWGMSHPLWTLALLLLILFLLWGLLQAIAQFAAGVWLGLGRLPIHLFRGIGTGLLWMLRQTPPTQTPPTPKQKLDKLLAELEQVQQEQQRLTKEIKVLLQQYPLETPAPKLLQKFLTPSSSDSR